MSVSQATSVTEPPCLNVRARPQSRTESSYRGFKFAKISFLEYGDIEMLHEYTIYECKSVTL